MKKRILFAIFAFLSATSIGTSNAGIVGDINNDGNIDLTEAIYALQVSAGIYPSLDPSCLLVGKGSWETGEDYNPCDVVEYGSLTYACIESNTSDATNGPPDPTSWTPLTLRGEQGPPGQENQVQFLILNR